MTSPVADLPPPAPDSLPPLGGRLIGVYRTSWWLLLAAAVATVAGSWIDATTPREILALRLVKAAVLVAVATILFRRRQRDPVAAMLSLAFLLWTVSSSIDFVTDATWAAIVDRCRFLLFALALLLFPDGAWQPRWTRPIAIAIVGAFLLGLAEASGLTGSSLYLPIAIGCVIAALVALFARFRQTPEGARQQQLKWVMLGLVAGIGLILSARAAARLTAGMAMPMAGSVAIEGAFQLGIVILALGFLVSLLRFRLYDAEAAISRSAIYAGLTLALVGTFAACEALIELLGQRFLGSDVGSISGAVAAAVAAVLLAPLHGRLSGWAEERFQHDLAVMKRDIPDLLLVLSSSSSIAGLAAAALPHIERGVQATRLALMVDRRLAAAHGLSTRAARALVREWRPGDEEAAIHRDERSPFPLQLALRCPAGEPRAWLLVGPRPDGSSHGRDDADALAGLAPAFQRALFQVAGREGVERKRRAEWSALRRTLDRLDARLDALEQAR